MYQVDSSNILELINQYNEGKNTYLEQVLGNITYTSPATARHVYIKGRRLPLTKVNINLGIYYETYYTHMYVDYHRIWYDAYTEGYTVVDGVDTPSRYLIDEKFAKVSPKFALVDQGIQFVNRSNSPLLKISGLNLENNVVSRRLNKIIDYIRSPSTDHMKQIQRSMLFRDMPLSSISTIAMGLRTFSTSNYYNSMALYMYNMLLTVYYTDQYMEKIQRENNPQDMIVVDEYLAHVKLTNPTIIHQINELSDVLRTDYMLESVQEDVKELVQSVIYLRTVNKDSMLGLWKAITSGKKVGGGSGSAFGSVYTVDIVDKIKVLVKTSQHSGNLIEDDIAQRHESYIGFRMNELRRIIPNFMYCYGLDYVTPPYARSTTTIDDRSNEVILWDSVKSGNEVPNIFIEYIDNSKAFLVQMSEFFNKTDKAVNTRGTLSPAKSAISLLTQLALALHTAYRVNGFMHNDLHANNMLVIKLDHPVWINYQYNNRTIHIYTQHIVTVIDYGLSSVRQDVESSRYIDSPTAYIRYPEGNRLSDILKAYMGIMSTYAPNVREYSTLFDIFSKAFGSGHIGKLNADEVNLLVNMTPDHQYIPPGITPGLELDVDAFYNALLESYARIEPQDVDPIIFYLNDDIIDLNPVRTQYINTLPEYLLSKWIVASNYSNKVRYINSDKLRININNYINDTLFAPVILDCSSMIDDRTQVLECIYNIDNDILTQFKVDADSITYVADIVLLYQYMYTLCTIGVLVGWNCNTLIPQIMQAFKDIKLNEFIARYKRYYYYLNNKNRRNRLFSDRQITTIITPNINDLFVDDNITKSFILNVDRQDWNNL